MGLLSACNISKHASNEARFLYKNKIQIKESEIARFYESDLLAQIKQQPNKKILGIYRMGLRFYVLGSKGKDSKFKQFLRYQIGETPVVIDSTYLEASVKAMNSILKTQGFYYPKIHYKIVGPAHRSSVLFNVAMGKAYTIYKIERHIADPVIDSIVSENLDESFIRLGNPIRFENLLNEQNRITDLLRNNGYFGFTKEAITFDFDTIRFGNFRAMLGINIQNPEHFKSHETFKVDQINVSIESNFDSSSLTKNNQAIHFKDFSYNANGFPLKPTVLKSTVLISPNTLFNQKKSNGTFQRLSDLQLFKTVNINAIPKNEETDSAKVDYFIRLVPASKFNFSIEPQLITTDQANLVSGSTYRNYGLATVFTSNINNIFRGAEMLQFRYRIALEAQRGPSISEKPFFNSFESALNANLIFPKLLGFLSLDKALENSINKTIISSSVLFEQNVNWKRTVFSMGLNYQFSKKQLTFQVTPSEISFIRTDFANSELAKKSKNDPYLQSIFANNLITNSRLGLLYNNQSPKKNNSYFFIRWDVLELAGIIPSAVYQIFDLPKSDSGYYQLFGVRFFNYAKTYADVRFNHFIDVNNKVVYRMAVGCALPFWNSDEYVPFDKRFFNGGANSIRAFLPRSLGPGSYNVDGQLDRSGDMKIEANAEYRFNIFKRYFEGALFLDAGNIWRIKEDGRKEASFHFQDFYKQLAIGTGFGFRLNLDFLVFRIDWALPVMDPRKIESKRFVLPNYVDVGQLWDASILNFGVGYPF